jgi:hypothetical protein
MVHEYRPSWLGGDTVCRAKRFFFGRDNREMIGQTVKIACIAFSFFILAQASYGFKPLYDRTPAEQKEDAQFDACAFIISEALSGIADPPEQHLKNFKLCNVANATCTAAIKFMREKNKSVAGLNCDGK